MEIHIDAQRHANCSDQDFTCLQCIYHEIDSQINFPEF